MEKERKEEIGEAWVTAIKNVVSDLNAFDWDVESCRKMCIPKKGDSGPATDSSFFFEEDLLSRLRLIERGLIGISEGLSDTMNTLRELIPATCQKGGRHEPRREDQGT